MTDSRGHERPRVARLPGLVVLAVGVVGGVAWLASGAVGPVPEATVERGDLVIGVEVSGTLEAVHSVFLGPPQVRNLWNFKIAMILPEGMPVRQGMPVVRFDSSELERDLRTKIAERDSAEQEIDKDRTSQGRERRDTRLRLAEAEARLRKARLKVDVPSDLVGANELQQARIDLDLAEQEVEHLRQRLELQESQGRSRLQSLIERRDRAASRVEEIQEQIRKMTILAPRDGTVIYPGDRFETKKKVGDSVWKMERVVAIPDLEQMKALGEVDEADAGRVAEGQRVALRLDAHPDVEYGGTVSRIHRTVQRQRVNPSKVVRLEIDLDQTDPSRMRPGMRFRGTVEIERHEDLLLAPAEAVFSTAEGPVAYETGLWGRPHPVHPEVGLRNDSQVQILSGLEAGDRLRLQPPEDVEP